MRERLIGREQEYGMTVEDTEETAQRDLDEIKNASRIFLPHQPPPTPDQIRNIRVHRLIDMIRKEPDLPFLAPTSGIQGDSWMANGSRIYIDMAAVLETASAECRVGSLDIVLQEKASEMILNRAVKKMIDAGIYRKIFLYKNNTGPSGEKYIFPEVTYGHHQNYMYDAAMQAEISRTLKTFLPVSLILSGSGHVYSVNSEWRYVISPRASHIVCEESAMTTQDRPLVNNRESPNRLHLVSRDATRCEFQTWLVDMVTHLVIRLAEEEWAMPDGFALQAPVMTLHAANNSFEKYLNGDAGTWLIAPGLDILQYNRVFLEAAKQLNPLSENEKDALQEWERILELLAAKSLDEMVGELDWVTKWHLLRNQMKKHGYWLNDLRAWKTDLAYHDISDDPNQSWFARLDELGYIKHLVEKSDVEAAMTTPPLDTRAFSRGRFVRLAWTHKNLRAAVRTIDWAAASIGPDDWKTYYFGEKGDPFSPVSSDLETIYRWNFGIRSE